MRLRLAASNRTFSWILFLAPLMVMLWIWLSALSFVPVPWPDDSAFYFVGRELFKWPPRWVMLPQAPFEPTYRIFNFNTMPLYPILVGLGRFIGIDGSHAIKFWPLAAFGLSASLLGVTVFRVGLPFGCALGLGLLVALDPEMRWASVLVRPESLIGLAGVALVLGLCLGFPRRFRPRGLWHPVAALLALGAYAHFNAVHLLLPVLMVYWSSPREIWTIGTRSLLYLAPWLLTVAIYPKLFIYQMTVQWTRLAVHNTWLDSTTHMLKGLFQDMGSPEPWPESLLAVAVLIWVLMIGAIIFGLLLPIAQWIIRWRESRPTKVSPVASQTSAPSLVPAAGWILGSAWVWYTKPEVWFVYYIHIAVWTFVAVALVKLWKRSHSLVRTAGLAALLSVSGASLAVFAWADVSQAYRLGQASTWHWPVYRDWVGCIDEELKRAEARLSYPKPFRVWGPTFPDVTIELSRLHPDWQFSRTNDFHERAPLAIQHGRDVEAVVVTEMINWTEREISGPQSEHPEILSVWMTWTDHMLNRLWVEKGWKPQRYLCQRGRWQAFIFEK